MDLQSGCEMTSFSAHRDSPAGGENSSFSVQFHLLGSVPFEDFLALQRRLVYEAGGQDDGRITVLLCEHPALITVGRLGSRLHIRLTGEQLRNRQIPVRYVSRGGGCVLHGRGQLAVYPIAPLWAHRWTVGDYLSRLQQALTRTLEDLGIKPQSSSPHQGIWGRSGQLVNWGFAVKNWVTCHGAFVNVNPTMTHYPFVDVVDPMQIDQRYRSMSFETAKGRSSRSKSTMGSLFAERRRAMSTSKVRATLIPSLAEAFGTERYHLITGHPWLADNKNSRLESRSCVS